MTGVVFGGSVFVFWVCETFSWRYYYSLVRPRLYCCCDRPQLPFPSDNQSSKSRLRPGGPGLGFRVQGLGFRARGVGFRVFGVQGLGCLGYRGIWLAHSSLNPRNSKTKPEHPETPWCLVENGGMGYWDYYSHRDPFPDSKNQGEKLRGSWSQDQGEATVSRQFGRMKQAHLQSPRVVYPKLL